MRKIITKSLKALFLASLLVYSWTISMTNKVEAAPNNVPDYYYANYKFVNDWNEIWNIFSTIISRQDLWMDVDRSLFSELTMHFNRAFPHLTPDHKTVYEKCTLLSEKLSRSYSYTDLKALLWNSCYKKLTQAVSNINTSYTVKARATSNPTNWSAPLTVTFDARWSVDPSSETIPTDNFYRYYRDENWVDTPMWKWNVISYEFREAWKFIVHLVVRSSNSNQWILDGETDLTVNVSPKAANIVVYANTRKMDPNSPIKIWVSEWEKWIVFDGSATRPRWWRKILSHRWTIINSSIWYSFSQSWEWSPKYINVPLTDNWEYKITLTTKDNENNSVSEEFSLIISDPVSIIRYTPTKWTTSSSYSFDGSASYSLLSKLNTYIREIFDEEWNKISTEQWKKMAKKFIIPWSYLVRLTTTDLAGQSNVDIREIYVESTAPTPQFTLTPTNKRSKPSEFTLDASSTSDVDVLNNTDSLEYERSFSTDKYKIVSTENDNEKIVVQFDEIWRHEIKLKVSDKYWKSSTITKTIDVLSTLRPEIEAIPWAITRWKTMTFKSAINQPVITYSWDFGDKKTMNSEFASQVEHVYAQKWVYIVNLTVYDKEWNFNTVTERVFIWEVEYPIAAYRVKDSKWFYIQASDTCNITQWSSTVSQQAYPIDRYASLSIDPSISVNTQWNSNWLEYVYEPEWLMWNDRALVRKELWYRFNLTGCHYIDLTVKDSNIWKQDKTRIWFNVKNALPTIKNVVLWFPQYSEDPAWLSIDTNALRSSFECSWTANLTIKVTAVSAEDSDWNISRLRFYYYNADDPDRILEYKETLSTSPYVYFVIPRISWEYKFWVMVYDNDEWMIDSRDYLWSSPSVFFPAACDSADTPTVTLKLSSSNVEVWDTVKYTVVSRISSNNEDFETSRTFYYDFTWDWIWDLVTKKDTASYTFTEPYESGVQPRVAVEYRTRLGKADGAKIIVKNWIKPILFYNSYKNIVIFRDLSVWAFQQRQICFDEKQCNLWNNRYQRAHMVTTDIDSITWGSITPITKNNVFLQRYPDFWSYDVSIYLKNKYWISVQTWFTLKTTNNVNNGRIASWVNMITIPETTFNNSNPEIFLSKSMNSTLLMYLNYEWNGSCYVDTDLSRDSDWDWKTDNDIDLTCNTIAKVVYEPSYESAIWRIYFTDSKWELVFQNFYVSFEWYILELSGEDLELYNNITLLINGIDDTLGNNSELKSSLDVLRKNLNNRNLVSSTVMTIKNQIADWWINLDSKQNDLLSDILNRLANEDTIVSVWMNDYEKNKQEILTILPVSFRPKIESLFSDFENNVDSLSPQEKYNSLNNILATILRESWIDSSYNELVINPAFCNICDYFEVASYSKTCSIINDPDIQSNYDEWISNPTKKSWMPWRLKIILIILFSWVLIMWGIIIFFAIRARMNNSEDEDEW